MNQSEEWKFFCYSVDALISHSVTLEHTLCCYLISKSLGQNKHGGSRSHFRARGRAEWVKAVIFPLIHLHLIVCSLTEVGYNNHMRFGDLLLLVLMQFLNFYLLLSFFWDRFSHHSRGWSAHLPAALLPLLEIITAIISFLSSRMVLLI